MEDDSMRSNLKLHMNSLQKRKGQKNLGYYTRFQICQVLNLLMLILIWWSTNQFLSGHFHTYGVEVAEFYSKETFVRGKTHDPMCNAFPTVVSKISVWITMRTNLPKILDLLGSNLHIPYFLISFPPLNSCLPWIVSAPFCTVTFGFPNSKKNSCRGNYMRKYGMYLCAVSPSVKIQIMGGKTCLRCKGATLSLF